MRGLSSALILLVLATCRADQPPDLAVTLKFNKAVYRVGDHMTCDITFTNVSDRALRFIPIDDFLDATELQFKGEGSRLEKTIVLQGERLYDVDSLIKDAVALSPKQSYTRQVEATVRSQFADTSSKGSGPIVLDFEVSALVLSKPGKYSVTKTFDGHPEWLKGKDIAEGPPFWKGVSESPAVWVTFEEK